MAHIIHFEAGTNARQNLSYQQRVIAGLEESHALFTAHLAASKSDGERIYNRERITEVERRMKDLRRRAA